MKTIRILFGSAFLLWSLIATVYTVYFMWIAAIGIGWSGSDMGLGEFVWKLKAPILITMLSFATCFGLFFNKRWGSVLGLALCIVAMFLTVEMIVTGIGNGSIQYTSELLGVSLWLFFSFCLTVVFLKLVNSYNKLGKTQVLLLGAVISSVLLSYYTMFQ